MVKKTKITIFQALTLLAQKYQNIESAKERYALIISLYLSGVSSEQDKIQLQQLIQDEVLNNFQVSEEWNDINEDPVRRYFESSLCHQTLNETLDQLDLSLLTAHLNSLFIRLESETQEFCTDYVFKGLRDETISLELLAVLDKIDPTEFEYTENLRILIDETSFPTMKPLMGIEGKTPETIWKERKEKMQLLCKCAFAAIKTTEDNLPINLYEQKGSYYDDIHRGRIPRQDDEGNKNRNVKAYNLGIMRAYMHLPSNDPLLAPERTKYDRPTDSYTFRKNALIPRMLFQDLVSPFVCSISGTMLAQLKLCAQLKREGKYVYAENHQDQLKLFFKTFVAYMLYQSGGHSLKEFLLGLTFEEIRQEFADLPGFESLTIESLFKEENTAAFKRALTRTIKYNQLIINTKQINDELIPVFQKNTSEHEEKESLEQLVRKRLKTVPDSVKRHCLTTPLDFYDFHAEFLRQAIQSMQLELADYQKFSLLTLIYLLKDFLTGSTLTQNKIALAKSYSNKLQEHSNQIEQINTSQAIQEFSRNLTTLQEENVTANMQLEKLPSTTGRLGKKLHNISQEVHGIARRSRFFTDPTVNNTPKEDTSTSENSMHASL